MSIDAVEPQSQSVSFGNDKNGKKGTSAVTAGLTGAVAGAATGYFVGVPMAASKICELDADKFSKRINNADKMNRAQKSQFELIKDKLNHKAYADEAITATMDEAFPGKDKVSVKEYLEKNTYGKISSKEQLEKTLQKHETFLEASIKKVETLQKQLEEAKAKPTLGSTLAKAQLENRALKTPPTAAEYAEFAKNQKEAEALEHTLVQAQKKHSAIIELIANEKHYLGITNLAKDGEIAKEAFKGYSSKAFVSKLDGEISEAAKGLEKFLPKVNSPKNALIYGAIGTVAAIIFAKIFDGGKKTEA